QARDAEAVELARQDRLRKRRRHERLRGEVIDLMGTDLAQRADERGLVEQVAVGELDVVEEVGDALVVALARPPDEAVDDVIVRKQGLGEVGAILAVDSGDESAFFLHEMGSIWAILDFGFRILDWA